MEIKEESEVEGEGEEGVEGIQREQGDLELLTQEADLSGSLTSTESVSPAFCGLCGTAGWTGQGSRSIYIGVGRNLYSASQGAASYNSEPRGGNSGRTPFDGILWDRPCPPGQGVNSGGSGTAIPFLCGL